MAAVAYDADWYSRFREDSRASARAVVPMLLEWTGAASVVDIGCGQGIWLSVFAEEGVDDHLGVDGPHVDPAALAIARERFLAHDLETPFELERRFDLATCFEVAEHLPETSAAGFVASLARLAPIVAFSAAIPHQGGTGHQNERWPEYWAALFATHGMRAIDCIRPRIWSDPDVSWWYAQNLLLFADDETIAASAALRIARSHTRDERLAMVHPAHYLATAAEGRTRRALRRATRPLRRALGR